MSYHFKISLPTLHDGQVKAFHTPGRFRVGKCGRRFGKTSLAITILCDAAIRGQYAGYFAPSYKLLSEVFNEVNTILKPLIETSNKTSGVIRLITEGRIDFWSLENDSAGRSRKYHVVVIDEAAFTTETMMRTWEGAIRPTLLDYRGSAWVFSTPNGEDPDNFFWRCCFDAKMGFTTFYAPTWDNPYIPHDEIEAMRLTLHPLMFRQEIEAEFIDWRGVAFFTLENLLVEGQPIPTPSLCDFVFAVVDTAVKSGKEHDGTAVTYYAQSRNFGYPLVILDWELLQIDGDMLESWIPNVFDRCKELANLCNAVYGTIGTFIEDKQIGSVLIQQCIKRGLPAQALDTKITAIGKDERAVNASGYVYNGKVKICAPAFYKETEFKGQTRNHLISQVTGFRVGDKNAPKRADDLLDTFTYGVNVALGDSEGF